MEYTIETHSDSGDSLIRLNGDRIEIRGPANELFYTGSDRMVSFESIKRGVLSIEGSCITSICGNEPTSGGKGKRKATSAKASKDTKAVATAAAPTPAPATAADTSSKAKTAHQAPAESELPPAKRAAQLKKLDVQSAAAIAAQERAKIAQADLAEAARLAAIAEAGAAAANTKLVKTAKALSAVVKK
jgi:hypothetical protein